MYGLLLNLNENFNDNCSLHTAAPRPILERLVNRHRDFTEPLPLRVAMGTYNINGGKHFRSIVYKNVSLSDWIYAHRQNGKREELEKKWFRWPRRLFSSIRDRRQERR